MTTPIQPTMIPLRDINIISEGDRLFYELGHKKDIKGGYGDNWVRQGKFKEIENVKDFLKGDKFLINIEYLEHHNFMIIKNNTLQN
jgi:hypothetical protein